MARGLPEMSMGEEGLPGVQPRLAAAKMASLMCTGRALIAGLEEEQRGAKRRRLVQAELALEGKTHARLGSSMSVNEGRRTGAAMQQFQLFACSTTRDLFLRPDGFLIPKLDAHQHNEWTACLFATYLFGKNSEGTDRQPVQRIHSGYVRIYGDGGDR